MNAATIKLSLNAWYDMENTWDYAFVQVSTDGGATFTSLASDKTQGKLIRRFIPL